MRKLSIPEIVKNADELWQKVRWGSGGVPTCFCGCNDLYKLGDGRYKCKRCGKVFSDKSGTILHKSKVSKEVWLTAMFEFAVNSECSALSLQKTIGVNYRTAYMILQKLRYVVGNGELKLEGIVQCDEAYIGAEWKNVHLRKKMEYMRENGYLDEHNRYTRQQLFSAVSSKKSHILSLVDSRGVTRLIHAPNPITKETIKYILKRYGDNITGLITDESKLYDNLGIDVFSSNHSKHRFITKEGYSSNACENRFSWVKRRINGVFSHTSDKYLQLYLNQRQWNVNHKGISVEDKFFELIGLCSKYKVTNKDIYNFDYKSNFPISRRELVMNDERLIMEELSGFGFVRDMKTRYGAKYSLKGPISTELPK